MSEHFASAVPTAERFNDGLGPMQRWRRDSVSPETLGVIVQRVSDGETLKAVCHSRGWPHGKVLEWLVDDEERCGRYRRSKALGAEADVDMAKQIALGSDDPKLMVDTLFKGAAAHAPEIYGARMKVERLVNVTADAALVGLAGDMLAKIRELPNSAAGARIERVIDAESVATDAEV